MKKRYQDVDSLRRVLRELDEETFKEWLDEAVQKAVGSIEPQQPEFLSDKETQRYLRLGRTSLYHLRQNGLPYIKLGSKTIYRRSEVLDWIEQHKKYEKF